MLPPPDFPFEVKNIVGEDVRKEGTREKRREGEGGLMEGMLLCLN